MAKRLSSKFCKLGAHSSLRLISVVRKAVKGDLDKIKKYISKRTIRLFGDIDIEGLMYKSFITIVLENSDGELIAAVCVNNYPNIPSIPSWSYNSWLINKYDLHYVNSGNSLWVHVAVFSLRYKYMFLRPALKHLFNRFGYVQYVIFVVPPKTGHLAWIEDCSTIITPLDCTDPYNVQNLYMAFRHNFVVPYKIRRAVEQDNDDVVDLIDRHAQSLKKVYGNYYIAEIINQQDPNRHIIVAETDGDPVAVMCLTRNINYELLNNICKLETFHHLNNPNVSDAMKEEQVILPDMKIGKLEMDYEIMSLVSFPDELDNTAIECDPEEEPELTTPVVEHTQSDISLDIFDGSIFDENWTDLDYCYDDQDSTENENFVGHVESLVTCVVLTCTEDEVERWSKKYKYAKTVQYKPDVSEYCTTDNAFCIEIVAALPQHEAALNLLLEASYECFPGLSYCVLCLPTTEQSFPLLKMFVRVTQLPTSNFPQEIFVAHKASILCDVVARVAVAEDLPYVSDLLPQYKNNTMIMAEFIKSVNLADSHKYSYVFLCERQIVGFAILKDQIDVEYICSHYQVSTWTNTTVHKLGSHGQIEYFALSPIFHRHSLFLLQELHRLSDYSILYYVVLPSDVHPKSNRMLSTALDNFMPVTPSFVQEYSKSEEDYWVLPEFIGCKQPPFALYISTPLHCGISRPQVNTRIVVVGASDVGLSFIIALIFQNNPDYIVTYNNITLVSSHGICRQSKHKIVSMLMPIRSRLDGTFINLLSLRTYINVVNGVMSHINRAAKTITVNDTYLPYDILFLMCGKQRQMPQRSKELRGKRVEFPSNVFVVNTQLDAETAISKLQKLILQRSSTDYKVIVYGYCIETYACLAALQEYGVPNENLILVEPLASDEQVHTHKYIFNEGDVADAVDLSMKNANIQVYTGYHFIDWTFEKENVTFVKFESRHRIVNIGCLAMFAYTKKVVSTRTHRAIHRAGLVFDGALVIGPDCRTNDPAIFAAGTFTKYPRRYYAEHMRHKYFNQEEIGRNLASVIRKKLVTHYAQPEPETLRTACHDSTKMLVPQYVKPLMVYATLPGKMYFLHVYKPGKPIPYEIQTQTDAFGQVLISGNCSSLDEQGYFRLHLNQYNSVETITCLSKTEIDRVNLTNIWGKHEKLLNNLVQRFEMVLIPDLFAFFKEPWAYALYHKAFKRLSKDINDIVMLMTNKEGNSVFEHIVSMFKGNGGKPLTPAQTQALDRNFKGSHYEKLVIKKVTEFFAEHFLYLPMYAHPLLVSVILGGYEESPLFK